LRALAPFVDAIPLVKGRHRAKPFRNARARARASSSSASSDSSESDAPGAGKSDSMVRQLTV